MGTSCQRPRPPPPPVPITPPTFSPSAETALVPVAMPPETSLDQETVGECGGIQIGGQLHQGDPRSPQNGSHTCLEKQQLLLANTNQDGSRKDRSCTRFLGTPAEAASGTSLNQMTKTSHVSLGVRIYDDMPGGDESEHEGSRREGTMMVGEQPERGDSRCSPRSASPTCPEGQQSAVASRSQDQSLEDRMPTEVENDSYEIIQTNNSPNQNTGHSPSCHMSPEIRIAQETARDHESGQERLRGEGALTLGGQPRLGEHSYSSPNSQNFPRDQQLTEQESGSEGGDAGHPSTVGNFYQLMTLQERS